MNRQSLSGFGPDASIGHFDAPRVFGCGNAAFHLEFRYGESCLSDVPSSESGEILLRKKSIRTLIARVRIVARAPEHALDLTCAQE